MPKNMNRLSKSATSAPSSPRIALTGCSAIAEVFYFPAIVEHPSGFRDSILADSNEARTHKLAERSIRLYLVNLMHLTWESAELYPELEVMCDTHLL